LLRVNVHAIERMALEVLVHVWQDNRLKLRQALPKGIAVHSHSPPRRQALNLAREAITVNDMRAWSLNRPDVLG
jgi:hypothetical protein